MGPTQEAPQGSDRAKLDGAFGVTWLVAVGPPGNQRDPEEGQFLTAKGEGLFLEKRKRG